MSEPSVPSDYLDLFACAAVLCTPDLVPIQVNGLFKQLIGASREGPLVNCFTRPSQLILNAKVLPQLALTGQADEIALDVMDGRGSAIPVSVNFRRIRWQMQDIISVVLFPSGERRRHEQASIKARRELDQYRDFLGMAEKLARVGHWNINLETTEVYWSPEIFHIHGRDARRYKPSFGSVVLHYHPDDRQHVLQIINRATETGDPFTFQARVVQHGTGDIRIVESTGVCDKDKDGYVSAIFGVSQDITDRAAAQRRLEESEETFRSAMEHASIGMALLSPAGRWLKVNTALCELVGYDEDELLQSDFQSITHPDDLAQDMEFVEKLLAGEINTYQMEKRYFRKSGLLIWALLSVSLVRDEAGLPLYFISQIQDITERKEMERVKSEFVSIVSHELRTPLTSIRGSLGLVLGTMGDEVSAPAHGLIDIAYKNCERLIPLINDILDIDKIAAGQMRFDVKSESVSDITRQAVDVNQGYAQKYGTEIVMRDIDQEAHISVDSSRFVQALSNLLSNAAKFSPAGQPVCVTTERHEGRIRICVSDEGPGITDEFRSRIFGRFSQAESGLDRAKGGSGLGLHITKQIVEHMGGAIGFDSQPDQGSTFWVEFPVLSADVSSVIAEDKVPLNAAIAAVDPVEAARPSVLHIEDDSDLTNVLAAVMGERARLTGATTLAEAERLLDDRRFDLIVLDIKMPDGCGAKFLEGLAVRGYSRSQLIVLSAYDADSRTRDGAAITLEKLRVSEQWIADTILQVLDNQKSTIEHV